MVSEKLFHSCPPFPEDVPLARLSTIPLVGLMSKCQPDIEKMFSACQESGFFLLDLMGDPVGEEMIQELESIFGVIEQTMHISLEEKLKYNAEPPRSVWGFKQEGVMRTETGQQDRCTYFGILQDDLLGNVPKVDVPEPVRDARPLLKSYVQHGQQVLSAIISGLESRLCLPVNTLRDLQSPNVRSGTMLRMIRGTPSLRPEDMRTGLLPHTDYGSVTLLANVMGGLQVLKPGESNEWLWVKPQPGCLIVNMGDAMVEWTAGVLRSNIHRVNHSPGEQRFVERFALAMLVRPSYDAKMERVSGGLIPQLEDDLREGVHTAGVGIQGLSALEWETKKSAMLRAGKDIAQSRGGRALRAVTYG